VCFHRRLHLNSNQISVLLLLSLFLDSKKGPHRNNETSNPFCGLLCISLGWESQRKTHTHTTQKKNVRSFSQIERIFFARVASKTHFCPHKKKAEKEIFRGRTRQQQQRQQQQQQHRVHRRLFEKEDEFRYEGEGATIEVLFRRATGRHDRRPRRVQVAEIRSEEHQIGVVPEKLLPMHASRLSREETGRKRRRQVRKRTQSREAELAAAQPKDGFAPRKIWEGREEEE